LIELVTGPGAGRNVPVLEALEFLAFSTDGFDGGIVGLRELAQGGDDGAIVNGPDFKIGGEIGGVVGGDEVNLIAGLRSWGEGREE